jgi:hypothetical protein
MKTKNYFQIFTLITLVIANMEDSYGQGGWTVSAPDDYTNYNIGIGIAAPSTLLTNGTALYVDGNGMTTATGNVFVTDGPSAADTYWRMYRNGAPYGYLYNKTGENHLRLQAPNASGALIFESGGTTERMRIASNGNLGVGEPSPSYLLDAASSNAGTIQDIGRFQNTGTATNNTGSNLLFAANRTTGGLTNVAGIAGLITDINNTTYKGALAFSTANGATPAERMRVTNDGHVGIGSTTPSSFVHINSSIGDAFRINGPNGNTTRFKFMRGDTLRGMIFADTSGINRRSINLQVNDSMGAVCLYAGKPHTPSGLGYEVMRAFTDGVTDAHVVIGPVPTDPAYNSPTASGPTTYFGNFQPLNVFKSGGNAKANIRVVHFTNGTASSCGGIILGAARGLFNSPTSVADGDHLGRILCEAFVATETLKNPASIDFYADGGTVSSNKIGGKITFSTAPWISGSSRLERACILSNGNFGVGATSPTANFQVEQGTTASGIVSNSGGTVTGSGTQFLNTFKIGDNITIGGETVAITNIATNTSMTTATISSTNTNVAYTLAGGIRFSVLGNGNVGIGTTAPSGLLGISQTIATSGAQRGIVYTGVVNTNQTLSTEIPSITFTTAGRHWATGALTTQREVLITQPTYSFVGGSTITDAATVGIEGVPIESTNATITNSHALLIQSGSASSSTNSYGLTVNAPTGATNNYSAAFLGGNVGIGTSAPVANARLAIKDGHLQSQQTTMPTISADPNLGTAPTLHLYNATDIAGTISFTPDEDATGDGSPQVTIAFYKTYTTAPIVLITPANSYAAGANNASQGFWVTSTTSDFTIHSNATGSETFDFNYHVIETVSNSY